MCVTFVEAAKKIINSEHYEVVTVEEKQAVSYYSSILPLFEYNEIFTAMSKEVGTGTGSFGGHWFQPLV